MLSWPRMCCQLCVATSLEPAVSFCIHLVISVCQCPCRFSCAVHSCISGAHAPRLSDELILGLSCFQVERGLRGISVDQISTADLGCRQNWLLTDRSEWHFLQHPASCLTWRPAPAGQVEDRLRERAELKYTAATVQQMASTFKGAAKRTRAALAALDLAGALRQSVQTAQQLRSPPGPHVPLAPQ